MDIHRFRSAATFRSHRMRHIPTNVTRSVAMCPSTLSVCVWAHLIFFARAQHRTHRQTTQRCDTCSIRPHLHIAYGRCSLIINIKITAHFRATFATSTTARPLNVGVNFFNFSHYAVTILFTTLTSTFHNLDYKPSLFIIRVSVDSAYIHKILVFFSFCYLLKYVCGCGLQ